MQLHETETSGSKLQTEEGKNQSSNGSVREIEQIDTWNKNSLSMMSINQNSVGGTELLASIPTGLNPFLMQTPQSSSHLSPPVINMMDAPMQQIMQIQQFSSTSAQAPTMSLQSLYPQFSSHSTALDKKSTSSKPGSLSTNKDVHLEEMALKPRKTNGTDGKKTYRDASLYADPPVSRGRNCGGVTEPFPEKLHTMLKYVEKENLTDIISFLPHGRAFAVHIPKRFVSLIMPIFFRQTRITSFQRQLNLYGFQRICHGPDSGAYYHELFLRGRPGLVVNMKRTKVKGTMKMKRDPSSDPDFYSMSPVIGDNQCSNFLHSKQEQKKKLSMNEIASLSAKLSGKAAISHLPLLCPSTMEPGVSMPQAQQILPFQQKQHLQPLVPKANQVFSSQKMSIPQAKFTLTERNGQLPSPLTQLSSSVSSLSGSGVPSLNNGKRMMGANSKNSITNTAAQHQSQHLAMPVQTTSLIPKVLGHPTMMDSMQFSQQSQPQMMLPMQQGPLLLYTPRKSQQIQTPHQSLVSPALGVFPNIHQLQQQQQQQQLHLMQTQLGMLSGSTSSMVPTGTSNLNSGLNLQAQSSTPIEQEQQLQLLQQQNQTSMNLKKNSLFPVPSSIPSFSAQSVEMNSSTKAAI